MSLLGSAIPSQVGLQLLLRPLGSNVVIRTACCSVGIVLPVYNTFKAIELRNQNEQQKWLVYWAAYGSFSLVEIFTDKFVSWFPLYYHMKFAFLVWLQLPSVDVAIFQDSYCTFDATEDAGVFCVLGAKHLYMRHLRPFLLKHQATLDQLVGFTYQEMAKFVSAHQAEFQFVKSLIMNAIASATQMMGSNNPSSSPPEESHGRDVIEGPPQSDQDD